MEPYQLSITEMASSIQKGELSPVELMKSVLQRSEQLGDELKVWVNLDPETLMKSARESESNLVSKGPQGMLDGIPIGLKDIFCTEGIPTTACSDLFRDFIPDYDATSVAALKNSGSLIMGKLVTTAYAALDPSPTLNPWDKTLTPGGSSSGSAVSVATGICPGALGSQTVGSTLRPAAYTGIVGFKPTFGRISAYGVLPLCWSLDTVGIITRTVADAALLLQVMSGKDPLDSRTIPVEVEDYLSGLSNQPNKIKIGIVKDFFYGNSEKEITDHIDGVMEKLEASGAEVIEIQGSLSLDELLTATTTTFDVEAAATHGEEFQKHPQFFPPLISEIIERGLRTPSRNYVEAQKIRSKVRGELATVFEQVDVLATPSTPAQAPLVSGGTTGPALFQGPWTTCGLPSISIPSGLDLRGLPLGLQLAAPWLGEKHLLSAAQWCETVLGPLGDTRLA